MGWAFSRKGRFQPYGWTHEWPKIDVIILSKPTDTISIYWARVFTTVFTEQTKLIGGGATRLPTIHLKRSCSLNLSLIWRRFVVGGVSPVTALIFHLQSRNRPRHWGAQDLERHNLSSLPFSCLSKLYVRVWSEDKTSLVRDKANRTFPLSVMALNVSTHGQISKREFYPVMTTGR